MSDFFNDPSYPHRPKHPDFWKLSEIVLQLDGRASEGESSDILGDEVRTIADPEAVAYLATHRAIRGATLMGLESKTTNTASQIVGLAAMWMEAFIVGARFQERNR